MTITEINSKRDKTADNGDADRPLAPEVHEPNKRHARIVPRFIMLALATLLGWVRRRR